MLEALTGRINLVFFPLKNISKSFSLEGDDPRVAPQLGHLKVPQPSDSAGGHEEHFVHRRDIGLMSSTCI